MIAVDFPPFPSIQTVFYLLRAAFLHILVFVKREKSPLRFTADGTFQLSVFEDLHYGEAEHLWWGPEQDINSTRVMNSILDAEKQQLVVLNGDLITGENTLQHNSTDYIDAIVQPMLQRNLPWASAYGNHDSSFNLSRQHLLAREQTWPNARTQQMVHARASGVSNYYLPVYGAQPWQRTPQLILWFFDSRGGQPYQRAGPDGSSETEGGWVDGSVVAWFERSSAALRQRYGRAIPSLAFVHIPVHAMRAFQAGAGVRPHAEPGINDDDPLAGQGEEGANDDNDEGRYGGQDVAFMRALLRTDGLLAVFSGHDHGDDWCFRWAGRLAGMNLTGNGLHLCFGRRSGYGGYGAWARGSRQVRVSMAGLRKREVETWVRLETGEVTGKVTLNSTYGRDYYPSAPSTSS